MAERSNAAVLKTVVRLSVDRGFESLFLRIRKENSPGTARAFYFTGDSPSLLEAVPRKAKSCALRSNAGEFSFLMLGSPFRDHQRKLVIPLKGSPAQMTCMLFSILDKIFLSPLYHHFNCRHKALSHFSQGVLYTWRNFSICLSYQKMILL